MWMSAIGSPRSGPRDRSWDARCLVESNTCERRDGKQDWAEVEIKLPCRLGQGLGKPSREFWSEYYPSMCKLLDQNGQVFIF